MKSKLFLAIVLATASILTSISMVSAACYSENFDRGTPGQSITEPPFSYVAGNVVPNDRLPLGSGEHGWTGNYIDGSAASSGKGPEAWHLFLKYFPTVSSGMVVLSCKVYAEVSTSNWSTIGLLPDFWTPRKASWTSTPEGWRFEVGRNDFEGKLVTDSEKFTGAHGTTGNLKISVDLSANKIWGQANWMDNSGKAQKYETARYDWDSKLGNVSGIFLIMDNRNGVTGIDIDDITVEGEPPKQMYPSKSGWQTHAVRQLNGRSGQIELPSQFQIVTESWNRIVYNPYIVYMPEKDRLVMLVYCDLNHRAMVLFSDDHGATWSKPQYLHTDAQGNPDVGFYTNLSLTYLGNGKLVADEDWCSDDYGNTWYALNAPGPQNVKGQTCYGWDPRLVDKDPKTGKVIRLVENSYAWELDETGAGYSQGYIRFSADEAKTWTANLAVPEWRGVNEVAFLRAGNGNIIGACRTDNPERFKQEIDSYGGRGVSISKDNGDTWSKLKMLYEWGRHHPSMVLLPNNDILMTYVVRAGYINTADGFSQFGIEAVISHDNGETWDLDHRYLLSVWQGNRKGANGWWAGSQCTSTVLFPDGDILTAFGTGYRSQPDPAINNSPTPWDVGLVKWRVNKNPVNSDRRITDAAFDSDLRNQFDPNPSERKKAESDRASEKKNIAVAKEGCQARASHSDKDPGFILENPYHSFSPGFLDTTPGWIEISWPKKHRISEVDIYAGEPAYAIYPSTECVPLDYLLQYQKAGVWVNLVPPVTNAMRYLEFAKTEKQAEDFKYVHKFAPTSVKKIRIYVTRSSDIGKRISSPDKEIVPPEKRATGFRRIEVFE